MFIATIMSLTIFGSRCPRCCSVIVAPILFGSGGGRERVHNAAAPPYQNGNTPSSPRIKVSSSNTMTVIMFGWRRRCSTIRHFSTEDGFTMIRYSDWRCSTMFGGRWCRRPLKKMKKGGVELCGSAPTASTGDGRRCTSSARHESSSWRKSTMLDLLFFRRALISSGSLPVLSRYCGYIWLSNLATSVPFAFAH